jgi:hypothetical protein
MPKKIFTDDEKRKLIAVYDFRLQMLGKRMSDLHKELPIWEYYDVVYKGGLKKEIVDTAETLESLLVSLKGYEDENVVRSRMILAEFKK